MDYVSDDNDDEEDEEESDVALVFVGGVVRAVYVIIDTVIDTFVHIIFTYRILGQQLKVWTLNIAFLTVSIIIFILNYFHLQNPILHDTQL